MGKKAINVKKRMWKRAGKIFGKMILAGVLGAFVYFSLTMIFTSMGTSIIGEQVYEQVTENGSTSWVLIETKYYSGTTTGAATTATSGTTAATGSTTGTDATGSTDSTASTGATTGASVTGSTTASTTTTTTTPIMRQPIYSEMSGGLTIIYNVVTTACMLLLLVCMCYSDMWTLGDKDNNNVNLGRMAEDKLYGLKVGLLASVPSFITFVLLVISKCGGLTDKFIVWYRLLNMPSIMPLMLITDSANETSAISAWLLIPIFALLLIVPAFCALGYFLGYKEYSLSEHFLYVGKGKKKKNS
ncbi:MAG: hypothetical protein IJF42_06545 [Clostridia bacterium]|nr:hypothetical protein [Clostridia bacterium]